MASNWTVFAGELVGLGTVGRGLERGRFLSDDDAIDLEKVGVLR